VETDCPERLLKAASPFKDGHGAFGPQWRADCRKRRADMRPTKGARPQPGQRFRTLRPVTFRDGSSHSEFTCIRVKSRGRTRTVYQAPGSAMLYRFRPETFGFEIISVQTNGEGAR
jgi:hypothetical protein